MMLKFDLPAIRTAGQTGGIAVSDGGGLVLQMPGKVIGRGSDVGCR
jgi:hypothetical protein